MSNGGQLPIAGRPWHCFSSSLNGSKDGRGILTENGKFCFLYKSYSRQHAVSWCFNEHRQISENICHSRLQKYQIIQIREGPPKKRFIWEIFPKYGWVGWLIPKQGPNPSTPEFHLSFSQISQKPWGGWMGKHIWDISWHFGRLP